MIKYIIHKIAFTCKEATYLMELKDSNSLTPIQDIRLKLHLKICKMCKKYELQQRKVIKDMMLFEEMDRDKNVENVQHLKERIIDKLNLETE